MKLASIKEFKDYAAIAGSSSDPRVGVILDGLFGAFQSYTGLKFEKKERSEQVWAEGSHFYLPAWPVDTSQPFLVLDDGIEYEASGYIVGPRGRVQLKSGEFSQVTYPSLLVTWTGGYAPAMEGANVATGDTACLVVPDELKRATLLQAQYEFKNSANLGSLSVSMGGASVQIAPMQLMQEVRRILDAYRGLIFV